MLRGLHHRQGRGRRDRPYRDRVRRLQRSSGPRLQGRGLHPDRRATLRQRHVKTGPQDVAGEQQRRRRPLGADAPGFGPAGVDGGTAVRRVRVHHQAPTRGRCSSSRPRWTKRRSSSTCDRSLSPARVGEPYGVWPKLCAHLSHTLFSRACVLHHAISESSKVCKGKGLCHHTMGSDTSHRRSARAWRRRWQQGPRGVPPPTLTPSAGALEARLAPRASRAVGSTRRLQNPHTPQETTCAVTRGAQVGALAHSAPAFGAERVARGSDPRAPGCHGRPGAQRP